jgi:hypothetical protein
VEIILPEESQSESHCEDEVVDDELDETTHLPWPQTSTVAGRFVPPPSIDDAKKALVDLTQLLRPRRETGAGYKDPGLDLLLRSWLERMKMFLWHYTDTSKGRVGWMEASLQTAHAFQKGPWLAG